MLPYYSVKWRNKWNINWKINWKLMLYRVSSVQIVPTLGPRLNLAAAVLFGG